MSLLAGKVVSNTIFCTEAPTPLYGHSRPQSPSFLGHVVGKRGAKQPLPDVRKFLTSGRACAKVTNITANAHKGFLSLTALMGEKFYFLSSP